MTAAIRRARRVEPQLLQALDSLRASASATCADTPHNSTSLRGMICLRNSIGRTLPQTVQLSNRPCRQAAE